MGLQCDQALKIWQEVRVDRCCLWCIYMPAIDGSLSLCCLHCIYMPAIDRSLSDRIVYTCLRLIDLSLIAGWRLLACGCFRIENDEFVLKTMEFVLKNDDLNAYVQAPSAAREPPTQREHRSPHRSRSRL